MKVAVCDLRLAENTREPVHVFYACILGFRFAVMKRIE